MADKKNLLLLFDRPNEPIFVQKGQSAVFDVPDKFLTDRYRSISNKVQTYFTGKVEERIPVRDITIPDLRVPMSLSRDVQFSIFIPAHRRMASHLIDIFMGASSIEDLQSVAVYARDRLNPYLFNYALSVALLHRKDTRGLNIPPLVQNFPDKFVDSRIFRLIREEVFVVPDGSRRPITIPRDYTASDLDPEHRLWYFREDIGVNLHHWHWHLVYPFEAGGGAIVEKDRRGELFYYMHQQMLARYNLERFSNNLARVLRFNNLRDPIKEGYFPKLDSLVASRSYPPRFKDTKLSDVNRPLDQVQRDVSDLERWSDRILNAIAEGFVIDESGKQVPLDDVRGIDILGNLIESSILSPNRTTYGDLHNKGHMLIAFSHDPDHSYLEQPGIMGDTATAMRDPIFYRWHAYMDDIFQQHKTRLKPYPLSDLSYPEISITGVQVDTEGSQPNVLQTFWQQSDIDISGGLDFLSRGDVLVRFTHLQHTPFTYTININNDGGAQRYGTVRIFLGPKRDETHKEMLFKEQRLLMVELDKFIVSLNPGQNTIRRRSSESSVTIPFEQTFPKLDKTGPGEGSSEELETKFCGCGWPHHMLIPKGLPEGLCCELFVMVSDYDQDRIDEPFGGACKDASSYCGLRDRRYPDRRAMGYPFDRLAGKDVNNLAQFLTPNMKVVDVEVRHEERTEQLDYEN